MSLQIKWTSIALQSLSDVFEYTFDMFGNKQLTKLRIKISETTKVISTFPLAGKKEIELSEQLQVHYRSIIVLKEIKLIYSCTSDTVFIEYVMNTRQDKDTIAHMLESTK